jgi:hypothetical protein
LLSVQNIAYGVLAVGVIVWIVYRQMTWRVATPSRMWRMPVILAAIGVLELSQVKGVTTVSGIDLAILGGELVIALGVGAGMGALAHFRTRPQRASDVGSRARDGAPADWSPTNTVVESRTGVLGAILWVVMIAVRVGIEFGARSLDNSALISSVGVILLVIAANRIARVVVIAYRLDHKQLQNA